nr:hypothetical protein [Tanacetum cinerariifolium]
MQIAGVTGAALVVVYLRLLTILTVVLSVRRVIGPNPTVSLWSNRFRVLIRIFLICALRAHDKEGLAVYVSHPEWPVAVRTLCSLLHTLIISLLAIYLRSHADPTLLNDFEMASEGNSDPPVLDLWTIKELNSINTFEQMAKLFLRKYFPPSMVTKLRNEITNFRQHPDESLFEALTSRHRDTINAAAGGTFMKRRPEECYDLIENMTAHHNDWDTSAQRSKSSSSITSSSDQEIVALKAEMAKINKNLMKVLKINQQVKAVTPRCETCGSPHSYNDCPATIGQTQNVYAAGAYQGNSYQPQ